MKRFKEFIDKELNLNNVKNTGQLATFEIRCRSMPDPPEEFDEFEFVTGYSEQMDMLIGVAIELGKIKRVLFGLTERKDPDSFVGLTESQLEEVLNRKGERLVSFFEFVTQ